jgi:hypothetical protein
MALTYDIRSGVACDSKSAIRVRRHALERSTRYNIMPLDLLIQTLCRFPAKQRAAEGGTSLRTPT